MSSTEPTTETPTQQPAPPATVISVDPTHAHVVVDGISPAAVAELRKHVEDATGGGNRFIWFLFGFIAALVAGAVAALVFLIASDDDDDGEIDLEVPTVDVSIDG